MKQGVDSLESDSTALNQTLRLLACLGMIFSDLPTPAEASVHTIGLRQGFAQAGNRYPLFRDHALNPGLQVADEIAQPDLALTLVAFGRKDRLHLGEGIVQVGVH